MTLNYGNGRKSPSAGNIARDETVGHHIKLEFEGGYGKKGLEGKLPLKTLPDETPEVKETLSWYKQFGASIALFFDQMINPQKYLPKTSKKENSSLGKEYVKNMEIISKTRKYPFHD